MIIIYVCGSIENNKYCNYINMQSLNVVAQNLKTQNKNKSENENENTMMR
jgi:hypothetical protein